VKTKEEELSLRALRFHGDEDSNRLQIKRRTEQGLYSATSVYDFAIQKTMTCRSVFNAPAE